MSAEEILQKVHERFALTPGEIIAAGFQVAHHFASLLDDLGKEKFGIIYLNAKNAFLHSEVLFEGSLTSSAVYSRELIKRALMLNAVSVIISHNHPSGQLRPSEDDQRITSKIKAACEVMAPSWTT